VTLAELFAKDPHTLTEEEELRIIAELRSARERWFAEEKKAKMDDRRAKFKAEGLSLDSLGITLDSLAGLEKK
jgi:hypothetical protein